MPIEEIMKRVTRAATLANKAVVRVRQVAAPVMDASKGGEARLPVTQENSSTPSKVHLLGMEKCLKLLEDFVPSESKEEALGPYSKGP